MCILYVHQLVLRRRIHENTMKIILNFSSSMRDESKVSFQVLTIQSRGEKWRNTNDVARYLRARSRKEPESIENNVKQLHFLSKA